VIKPIPPVLIPLRFIAGNPLKVWRKDSTVVGLQSKPAGNDINRLSADKSVRENTLISGHLNYRFAIREQNSLFIYPVDTANSVKYFTSSIPVMALYWGEKEEHHDVN